MVLIYFANEPVIDMQKFKPISHISISPEQLPDVVPHNCHPPGSPGL